MSRQNNTTNNGSNVTTSKPSATNNNVSQPSVAAPTLNGNLMLAQVAAHYLTEAKKTPEAVKREQRSKNTRGMSDSQIMKRSKEISQREFLGTSSNNAELQNNHSEDQQVEKNLGANPNQVAVQNVQKSQEQESKENNQDNIPYDLSSSVPFLQANISDASGARNIGVVSFNGGFAGLNLGLQGNGSSNSAGDKIMELNATIITQNNNLSNTQRLASFPASQLPGSKIESHNLPQDNSTIIFYKTGNPNQLPFQRFEINENGSMINQSKIYQINSSNRMIAEGNIAEVSGGRLSVITNQNNNNLQIETYNMPIFEEIGNHNASTLFNGEPVNRNSSYNILSPERTRVINDYKTAAGAGIVVWKDGKGDILSNKIPTPDSPTQASKILIKASESPDKLPEITVLKNGNSVLSWTKNNRIIIQTINSDGKKIGPEFYYYDETDSNYVIKATEDGNYVIAGTKVGEMFVAKLTPDNVMKHYFSSTAGTVIINDVIIPQDGEKGGLTLSYAQIIDGSLVSKLQRFTPECYPSLLDTRRSPDNTNNTDNTNNGDNPQKKSDNFDIRGPVIFGSVVVAAAASFALARGCKNNPVQGQNNQVQGQNNQVQGQNNQGQGPVVYMGNIELSELEGKAGSSNPGSQPSIPRANSMVQEQKGNSIV
jgi:hypothetical protein